MAVRSKHRGLFEKKLKCHLLALVEGLKPSYLWDACEPTVEAVNFFTEEASALHGSLHVIQLREDVLVCDLERVSSRLQRALATRDVAVVDVSWTRKDPAILAEWPVDVEAMLASLAAQLQTILASADGGRRWKIQTGSNWNLCVAFGFLLGFPVVYWFDGEARLAMRSLTSVRVRCVRPAEKNDSYVAYAFSYPTDLRHELADRVSRWFRELRESRPDLELVEERVRPTQVML